MSVNRVFVDLGHLDITCSLLFILQRLFDTFLLFVILLLLTRGFGIHAIVNTEYDHRNEKGEINVKILKPEPSVHHLKSILIITSFMFRSREMHSEPSNIN